MRTGYSLGVAASLILLVSGCGNDSEAGSSNGSAVDVIEITADHGTQWDTQKAPVEVVERCISFGGVPAVFPEGSELGGSPQSLVTPAGLEIALDGTDVELIGDRYDVAPWVREELLDQQNYELLLECADRLGSDEFWVTVGAP